MKLEIDFTSILFTNYALDILINVARLYETVSFETYPYNKFIFLIDHFKIINDNFNNWIYIVNLMEIVLPWDRLILEFVQFVIIKGLVKNSTIYISLKQN